MSIDTNSKTIVGVPHFATVAKRVRSSNYDTKKCLGDLIDYPIVHADNIEIIITPNGVGGIHKAIISDDCPNGFEQIECNNSDNPLNMGHIRDGHSDDNETSEFGGGTKLAPLNMGDELVVRTHTKSERGDKFIETKLDFVEMSSRENPQDSYEPVYIDEITKEKFMKNRKLGENGSDVIISSFRNGTDNCFDDFDEEVAKYSEYLSLTYSDYLRPNAVRSTPVNLTINGVKITPLPDFMEDPLCKSRAINHQIFVKLKASDNQIEQTFVKRENKTKDTYFICDNNEGKMKSITHEEAAVIMSKPDWHEWHQLNMISTSVCDTPYHDYLPSNRIRVKRIGRNHGDSEKLIKNHNDGYSNHIYNEINYKSKKINKFVGITADKHVNMINKKNQLTGVIREIQKFTTKNLSSKNMKSGSSDDDSESIDGDSEKKCASKKNNIVIKKSKAKTCKTQTTSLENDVDKQKHGSNIISGGGEGEGEKKSDSDIGGSEGEGGSEEDSDIGEGEGEGDKNSEPENLTINRLNASVGQMNISWVEFFKNNEKDIREYMNTLL